MVMKENDIKIGYKLRFNFLDQGGLGPTGYRILYSIIRGHTLSKTAKDLDLSYRFVWGYINKLERRCGEKVVERRRGAQGGTSIRPCGSRLFFMYKQLSELLELSCEFYNEVIQYAPFRNTLLAKNGYIYGILDVFEEVRNGDLLVIPKHRNSARRKIILKPRVVKYRQLEDTTITTVSILEPTDIEGKIIIDIASIGIYRRPPDRRNHPRVEGL